LEDTAGRLPFSNQKDRRPETELSSTLILDSQAPRSVGEKFLLFKSSSLWHFVIIAYPDQDKLDVLTGLWKDRPQDYFYLNGMRKTADLLDQGLINYGAQANSDPLIICVNKVLLEHSCAYLLSMDALGLLWQS
jgi:hypothetical protein